RASSLHSSLIERFHLSKWAQRLCASVSEPEELLAATRINVVWAAGRCGRPRSGDLIGLLKHVAWRIPGQRELPIEHRQVDVRPGWIIRHKIHSVGRD